jgi:hypothetical protein
VQNSNTAGILYAYEVCDACEDDSFGYQIDNILLSDFVYPSWFESFRAEGSTQFDRMNTIQAPLQLLAAPLTLLLAAGGSRLQGRNIPRVCGLAVNAAIFLTTCGSTACPSARSSGNARIYRQQLQNIQRRREAG